MSAFIYGSRCERTAYCINIAGNSKGHRREGKRRKEKTVVTTGEEKDDKIGSSIAREGDEKI